MPLRVHDLHPLREARAPHNHAAWQQMCVRVRSAGDQNQCALLSAVLQFAHMFF